MRSLVITVGSPGSGKSTFLEKLGLSHYVLSSDTFRLMYSSPVQEPNGKMAINQKYSKKAFELMFQLLDERMSTGSFTIIDATHTKVKDINKYKALCEQYRYRAYALDFTNIPLETLKERNASRAEFKQVPLDVIERMYTNIQGLKIPNWLTKIEPDQTKFWDAVGYKQQDLSRYKKIHHIGDIHGCIEPLKEYFKDGLKDDECYIFVGDFTDRGLNNAEVLQFMFSIMDKSNVILLEGNHEIHLWRWALDLTSFSTEFDTVTRLELETKQIDKSLVRQLYRKMQQCVLYTYQDVKVFVSHGGVATLPERSEEIVLIPTRQLIKGVGTYEDIPYTTFDSSTPPNTFMVHGHRNLKDYPIAASSKAFNLEQKLEWGGFLGIVTLDSRGFTPIQIKNNTYKGSSGKRLETVFSNDTLIIELRNNPMVKERVLANNISSFNFSRKAFYKGIWDNQTIKARGLFINTSSTEIVAKSYNKMFNVGELQNTEMTDLGDKFVYPVTAYIKENGFLGLVGYDVDTDALVITSKSTNEGTYADMFKRILFSSLTTEKVEVLKSIVRDENVTLVFEVIDPVNDPHIIEYTAAKVVLLDAVKRTLAFSKLDYTRLIEIAGTLGVEHKRKVSEVLPSAEELNDWYTKVMQEDYTLNGEYLEGFMLEDSNGYQVKLKLPFYKKWKVARSFIERLKNRKPVDGHYLYEIGGSDFAEWAKKQDSSYYDKSIIELRKLFILSTQQ